MNCVKRDLAEGENKRERERERESERERDGGVRKRGGDGSET